MDVSLESGIFSAADLARLVEVPAENIRRWFLGAKGGSRKPVFDTPRQTVEGSVAFTFSDLVTALLIHRFREQGISLQLIRRIGTAAAKQLHSDRPFTMRRFATDGRTILMRVGEDADEPDDDGHALIDLANNQVVMRTVFEPLLLNADFSVDGIASRWWPLGKKSPVVIDPRYAFGSPIVESTKVPTRVLAGPVVAGDTPEEVARWFGVSLAEVLAAVEFEAKLHASA
jgi:uncharacterized protein (DUF433 family)/DNA-binding transcriptional MerR regulator